MSRPPYPKAQKGQEKHHPYQWLPQLQKAEDGAKRSRDSYRVNDAGFGPKKSAEREYLVSLRKVARAAAKFVETHVDGVTIRNLPRMKKILADYSEALESWAINQAERLVSSISEYNAKAFKAQSKEIGRLLSREVEKSVVGLRARELVAGQVKLIKSIPIEAGERAQQLAMEATVGGERASQVAQELARTQEVTLSRAELIARTEASKASTAITQARAESVGSEGYIWRTAEDADVRDSHKKMNGKYVRWDSPPTLDNTTGHPGEHPNCRCIAEPVIPD